MTKQHYNPLNKDEQRAYWTEQVNNWEQSKLKQKAYCVSAGISYNSFVYWKSILSSELPVKNVKSFIPVKVKSNEIEQIKKSDDIRIKLATGHIVCIPGDMDPKRIATLIQFLGMPHA